MNELALYAGVGGGILGGLLCGFKTVCAVEIDPYCREVLLQRQRDGMLPLFPIWDDVKTFDGCIWNGEVDIVTAGFPCQPFSVAGKGQGEKDERNMWPETIRIIREVRPHFAFLENVPGLLVHRYFGRILGDLAESGYDCQWSCLGADDVGATHRRKRLWILANSRSKPMLKTHKKNVPSREEKRAWGCPASVHGREIPRIGWPLPESFMVRRSDGVPRIVDRYTAIGNAQVPAVVKAVWEFLKQKYP